METITPIPLTRLKIPEAPPESASVNPPGGFARVMARHQKFSRPEESPVGLDQEEEGPNTPLLPEEQAKLQGQDPVQDPNAPAFLTTPISPPVVPSLLNRPWEPPVDLEDPPFFQELDARIPKKPTFASTEQIGPGSWIQPGPEDILIKSEERPAFTPALGLSQETLKENPVVSKALEDPILNPASESIALKQNFSPEQTESAIKSSQTTTENGPSFSPQGPAIPENTPIVDGLDPPSPSLILREVSLKTQISETTTLELKPDSQAPLLEAGSRTKKVAPTPILEGPPIAEASPIESNSLAIKISAAAASPAISKGILADGEISSSAISERLADSENSSPTLAGPGQETSSLQRAPLEKVEPGIALRDPGENLAGSAEQDPNIPFRVRDDRHPGVTEFLGQPRIEGTPADRSVEGPPKGSREWIQEAQSVYQQFSKGLLRTLPHSGERIQMTLNPPQLGNLLLEIIRDRNFVTAHLWTDNPHTKELLDFSQGQLQKTLELDGFKLDRFEVLVQPDLKSFQEERWFGGRQPAWENSRQEGSRASPAGLIPTSPETAALRFSQGNQYVDTWV